MDKLNHAIKYHPDKLLTHFGNVPNLSRAIGEQIGEVLKDKLYGNSQKSETDTNV